MRTIGLYLHIPYCIRKCGYCDFNSHEIDPGEMATYSAALGAEIRHYAPFLDGLTIATVFFGGGTPTTLPAGQLADILDACRKSFRIAPDAEISFETNPAASGLDGFSILREAGFNRVSIGAQSFHADELKFLERAHGPEEIFQTVDWARRAGFNNLSIDLMFSLPNQTERRWRESLDHAIGLGPEHISAYNLTIEPNTRFHQYQNHGDLVMPDEDLQLALFRQTLQALEEAGYRCYEISNYSRPGRECRHNINYWRNGDFLGLGAGASSCLAGRRFRNIARPDAYIRRTNETGHAVEFEERPDRDASMGETVMLGLRLADGLSLADFEERYQVRFESHFASVLPALLQQEWVALQDGRLRLTPDGLFLANSVILQFLPEPHAGTAL